MKKLLSIVCLFAIMAVSKAYGQSNITWSIKDDVQKEYFKVNTVFNSHVSGFKSKAEADAFILKLKKNTDVASVTVSNADVNGNANVQMVMKTTHDTRYYLGMAQTLNIEFVEVNRVKKTIQQWQADEKENK